MDFKRLVWGFFGGVIFYYLCCGLFGKDAKVWRIGCVGSSLIALLYCLEKIFKLY